MKTPFASISLTVFLLFAGYSLQLFAQQDPTTKLKLESALTMDHRSSENKQRDDNRNPVKAMEFCQLTDNMKVLEFGPGSGWYSEILGPVLQEKGELVIAYKDTWMEKLAPLLAKDFMSAVEMHPIDIDWNSELRKFSVGNVSYSIDNVDLALNIREYHNLSADGAKIINQATNKALKPGGYYCVIDHTRRHMEPWTSENRRRADPVSVILEIQAAGFILLDSNDLFFKPDDELRYEVGRKSVSGNTDRFALLFKKVAIKD
jgi:predicted methyltransferase